MLAHENQGRARPLSGLLFLAGATVLAGTASLGPTAGCVPSGSAPPYDAGVAASAAPTYRASLNVMTAVFEDTFDRPDGGESTWPALEPGRDAAVAAVTAGGTDAATGADAAADASAPSPFVSLGKDRSADAGVERAGPALGPNWVQIRTSAWRIENGKLCGQGARNHGIWLTKVLPVNARIEFDAVTTSDDGDLKAEVWGDGKSAATGTSYTNATSYLTIFGGWKNSIHAIARLDEHGKDRREIPVDKASDDPRQRPVNKGQTYRFKIERTDGRTVRWFIDNTEMLSLADAQPLVGEGHDHFGFNEWEVKVCFDNVKVTPL